MTATILVPLIIAIIGAVGYVLSTNPKITELSRLAFGCGLLAICFAYIGHSVHIG